MAKMQWVSTITIKQSDMLVSKDFLNQVRANWYYNKVTKCYGVNVGFATICLIMQRKGLRSLYPLFWPKQSADL